MLRITMSAIGAFVAWFVMWIGSEKTLSALGPEWFGAHQRAFQAALVNGGQFTADTTLLLTHLVLCVIVTGLAGFLAALMSGESKRAPLILGVLLLLLGLMKAKMSWPYVPIWYHVAYTALLLPMAILGGRMTQGKKR
jgi:hypothetical protein